MACKPLFKQLNFVIIGCDRAGKSEVCNAILGKKTFSFWSLLKKRHETATKEARGRTITVTRGAGWNEGNLGKKDVEREMLYCVNRSHKAGLHAVVFVVDANRPYSDATTIALEELLPEKVWDHTIVVLRNAEAHGEKLGDSLQSLVQKCGNRCCVLNRESICGITEWLEAMIAEKKQIYFGGNVDAEDDKKISLIANLRHNIKCLQQQKNKEEEKQLEEMTWQAKMELQKSTALKDVEIQNLQEICRKQEDELKSLQQEICSDAPSKGAAVKTSGLEITWPSKLMEILDNLDEKEFKRLKFFLHQKKRIPKSLDRDDLADKMIQVWGTSQCIIETEVLLKDLQRLDLVQNLTEFRKDLSGTTIQLVDTPSTVPSTK
ncbi:GTPase IMAP family member 7-like [Clupea harengus]|uniref:GTPase IMAP family member 7-like n=1 Tax=Clupea harengus TaxID=7950 RepID=A0A6P8GZC1_CLUHA|nr:GTPase IMAP family member 7-like [Clupea harengus]